MNRALWIASTRSSRSITEYRGGRDAALIPFSNRAILFNVLQARYLGGESSSSRQRPTELEQTLERLIGEQSPWTWKDWEAAEQILWKKQQLPQNTISKSFQLLDRMAREAQQQNFVLTCKHVNQVIDHWRIGVRSRVCRVPATQVLQTVEAYASQLDSLKLSTKTYSMIMAGQIKQHPDVAFCLNVVKRMSDSTSAPPNAVALTYLMDAHVQSGQANAVAATQSLFDYMVEHESMQPTEKSLASVLQAWVALSPPDTPVETAMAAMKRNIQILLEASRDRPNVLPSAEFLDVVLEGCGRLGAGNSTSTVVLADALVTHVMELSVEHPHLLPQAKTLSRMIFLLRKVPNAAQRAEYWLEEMRRHWQQVPGYDSPRYTVYAAAIAAWADSGLAESPWHADRIFQNMIQETGTATVGCYQRLISLWSQHNALDRAEGYLRDMVAASASDDGLLPPVSAFADVIQASQQQQQHASNRVEAASHAHDVLKLLLDCKRLHPDRYQVLDRILFETCLQMWNHVVDESTTPLVESKVRGILEWMRLHDIPISFRSIASVVGCLPVSETMALLREVNGNLQPTPGGHHDPALPAQVYEYLLQRNSESNDDKEDAGEVAEELLERYVSLAEDCRSDHGLFLCYRHVVAVLARSGGSSRIVELLGQMCHAVDKDTPNAGSLATVAEAWALSGLPDSTEKSIHYLSQAVDCARAQGNEPESIWYENVINALARNSKPGDAEVLLRRAENDGAVPTFGMYAPIIGSLVRSKDGLDLDWATRLLDEMVDSFLNGNSLVKPTAGLFGDLMRARARRRDTDSVQELWASLRRLQRHQPDEEEFRLDWGITRDPHHSGTDVSILHHLMGESSNDEGGISDVDEGTVACVMEALASSSDPASGRRAEGILLKMQELYDKGVLTMEPTFKTFQKVIDCWVNSTEVGSAARANDVLTLAETLAEDGNKRLRPDSQAYMAVIAAWSKSHESNAPDRILKLLRTMKSRYAQGEREFALTGSAYVALIRAFANSGNPEAAKLAKRVFDAAPDEFKDTELYNALIGAQGGDSINAEAILQEMHQSYLDGNDRVQPNVDSFNNILLAWSRSGSPMAAWRADGIFNRMNELAARGQLPVKPNGKTFDMVISTLANELGADGALKVERYLKLLKEYYRSGEPDCMPSVTSYTEAIRAWGSNVEDPRSVLRAKALLDEMHELAREGIDSAQPDHNTYSIYLCALAKSTVETKAELAKDVAKMMKSDGIRPEGHLLNDLQRCVLPNSAVLSGWKVLLDNTAAGDEGFVRLK